MVVYECLLWHFIGIRWKRNLTIPFIGKLLNSTFEITVISFVLFTLSKDFTDPLTIMHSPLTLSYFFFIILSIFRLHPFLSAYTGLVASVNYIILSLMLLESNNASLPPFFQSHFLYFVKGFIIFLCGISSGYVSYWVRSSISNSIKSLENQNQAINLFGQQVSREIAEVMLNQKGALESRVLKVCVIFIDIRNFASFAEKNPPEKVVAYQNAFFSLVIEVVNRHHGIINQFLGDGCMITFGAPIVLDNPCENAVISALEIIERVENASESGSIPVTRVGMGIHVGDAVTGNIGTELRQQYSITGNVVIQASRIEQLNKMYDSQILASREVMECITHLNVAGEEIGMANIKGMEEGLDLYKLK